MTGFPEFDRFDGLGLAELVRQGEVSSLELVEETVSRIERLNPGLNAVIFKMYDYARETARGDLPEGAFQGVPFLIKDLEPRMAGFPWSMACRAMKDYVPTEDNELVKRFKAAGFVILGKTNCPELGLMGTTEPELWGPSRNPWHKEHTTGGSSGGSGAAVAAGMVPMASGGDGGGSIRLPASMNGLFGLKPSRGLVPVGPNAGECWFGAVATLGLTRSVRDSAALLDALEGADIGAPYEVKPPLRPYLEEVEREPGRLKIAFSTRSPLDTPVSQEIVDGVHKTAEMLEGLGHDVLEAEPDYARKELMQSYLTLYFGEVDATIRDLGRLRGKPFKRSEVEPGTWALKMLSKTTSAGDFVLDRYRWNEAGRAVGRFFESHDLWLTPVMAEAPVKIGELMPAGAERFGLNVLNALNMGWFLKMSGMLEKVSLRNLSKTPFTQLANLTGIPAMSVPLHHHANGLPMGMHFMAGFGQEDVLFRLAGQLERAFPWSERRPNL